MLNANDYPANYGFLSPERQQEILASMRAIKMLELEYRKNARKLAGTEKTNLYKQLQDNAKLYARIWKERCFALSLAGIYVEYDWHGHRGEVFLATYYDALYEEDCQFENL